MKKQIILTTAVAALFPLPMWSYGYTTRRYPELLDAYRRAVPFARDERARWQLHRDLAAIHEGLGEFDLAADEVALAASVHYPAGRESLHTWHGLGLEGRDDLTGALGAFHAAWDAVALMANPVQEERARALLNMHIGRVLYQLGDKEQAHQPLAAAHTYFAARPTERANEARAGMWLGRVLADRGDDYLRDVPTQQHGDLYRCRSLLDAGVPLALSSDAPYGPLDPWAVIAAAVHRRTRSGAVVGPAERLTPVRALHGYLATPGHPGGPARRITVGAAADLVLLHTPLAEMLRAPSADAVRAVLIAGRPVTRMASVDG